MKKKNKIISLTLSTFLLFSAFGSAMFVNAEGENLDTNQKLNSIKNLIRHNKKIKQIKKMMLILLLKMMNNLAR